MSAEVDAVAVDMLEKMHAALVAELGREPTEEELTEAMRGAMQTTEFRFRAATAQLRQAPAPGGAPLPPQQQRQPQAAAACAACGAADAGMMCGRCRGVRYCGRSCQGAHWRTHRSACLPAAAAAATKQ